MRTSKKTQKYNSKLLILLTGFFCTLMIGLTLYYQDEQRTLLSYPTEDNESLSFLSGNIEPKTSAFRGTIYDRNYKELAVSHLLYKLYCEPAKIDDRSDPASILANILQEKFKTINDKIHRPGNFVEISANLSFEQARTVEQQQLPGFFLQPYEIRYYPSQTIAAHALGYTHKGQGLSGIEEHYDTILQPGIFSTADLPEIDFQSELELSEGETDISLTLDLDIQKKMERLLHKYLQKRSIRHAMALIIDPKNGAIYAMGSFPSFNPNCFWQVDEDRRINNLTEVTFSPSLIEPLIKKSLQSIENSDPKDFLSENNLTNHLLNRAYSIPFEQFRLGSGSYKFDNRDKQNNLTSGMELAATAASLINGGLTIEPYLLDSIYNHTAKHSFYRSKIYDQRMQHRIFSPADGIRIRRALSYYIYDRKNDFSLFTNSVSRKITTGEKTRQATQEIMLGWSPNKFPQALILIALKYDDSSGVSPQNQPNISILGDKLLTLLHETCNRNYTVQHPDKRNPRNYDRLLATRRLDYQPTHPLTNQPDQFMPEVTGLSLRQGLKILDKHHFPVNIKGSGRIVKQDPAPGVRIKDVAECTLTLESSI